MSSETGPEDRREGSAGAGGRRPSYHRRGGRANDAGLLVGLSSGTSMDGVDAALVRVERRSVELLEFLTRPYPAGLQERLRACAGGGDAARIARLDVEVGEAFATTALELLAAAAVGADELLGIGSHGQTLVHLPPGAEGAGPGPPSGAAGDAPRARPATLQIGSAAVIAERTDVTTVADFRSRDMAAGGQGAPLVPLLDWWLYRHPERGRAVLNLGGIANLTGLPAGGELDEVVAFDTGPANVLLDAAARERGVEGGFDRDGRLGLEGTPSVELVDAIAAHPFVAREPPKSADVVDFLGPWESSWRSLAEGLETSDLMATLARATAVCVAAGVSRIGQRQAVDEVLVSGGGVHNAALRRELEESLAPAPLRRIEEAGSIPGDAKEAVLFAVLARETLAGRPGNVPGATGAARRVVLGSIVPGRGARGR